MAGNTMFSAGSLPSHMPSTSNNSAFRQHTLLDSFLSVCLRRIDLYDAPAAFMPLQYKEDTIATYSGLKINNSSDERKSCLKNSKFIHRNSKSFRLRAWSRVSNPTQFSTASPLESISNSGENSGTKEGPSCIFVGPIETAKQSDLEELYMEARDQYYSGQPLIVDDMFDKIERRLRWFGSKLVQKYPRCSLKRYSAYADAELDQSQLVALNGIWTTILIGGTFLTAAPPFLFANNLLHSPFLNTNSNSEMGMPGFSSTLTANGALLVGATMLLGFSLISVAARSLKKLVNGGIVALKGCCPSCGEEVYAFIRSDDSSLPRHKCECHVCDHPLVFHATLEESTAHPGNFWAFGRIYLIVRASDLLPGGTGVKQG